MRRYVRVAVVMGVVAIMVIAGLRAGDRPTDAKLLHILEDHRADLTRVGDVLLKSGVGAKIDLRDDGGAAVPPERQEMVAILRRAQINLAEYDGELGGIAFVVYSVGISISGAESGFLYRPAGAALPQRAIQVSDLSSALEEARHKQPVNKEVDALLIRKVDERWALYLETF
jgi:hypothetical protein